MARLRLLLALCLIGVGTTFGALALSGYYNPLTLQKQIGVASADPKGSQLVRAKPRQRFVAADTQATTQPTTTHTIAQATTTQAATETLPWAKPKQPVVKSPPREAASKPKDKADKSDKVKEKRPQQAAATWPWSLFSN
jgi:septal ring-binding cell division protein DamX